MANRAEIIKDVSPHVLRHTFAKMALQKGISLPTLQKILGHDSLQTTAIYLNFTDVLIQDEFERKWRESAHPRDVQETGRLMPVERNRSGHGSKRPAFG